jgi:hypothetical protein
MRRESLRKQSMSSGGILAWLNHLSPAQGYGHSKSMSIAKPCVLIGLIMAGEQWLATAAGQRIDWHRSKNSNLTLG